MQQHTHPWRLAWIVAAPVLAWCIVRAGTWAAGGPALASRGGPLDTPTPCVSGVWTAQAPYPTLTGGHAVAAQGGILYSFGGIANNMSIANAYKYIPATNTWTAIAPLPAPRGWFSAVSDGTAIYLLGGVDQNFNTTATLWRYDPATNTYNTSLPSYTIPTYNHAAAYLGGKIYRIAGRGIGTDYHVEAYTIASNSWALAANYPFASHTLMAAAVGGYIVAGGGNSAPTKTYRYDPVSDTWDDAAIADLPVGRSAAASAVYNGRWLLAGGDVNFAVSTSVIAWDPGTNTWTDLPALLQARDYLAGAVAGPAFYAVAGDSGPGTPTNDHQQYLESGCATATPAPATRTPPLSTATPPPTATGPAATATAPAASATPAGATTTPPPTASATPAGATVTPPPPSSTPPPPSATPSPPPPSATPSPAATPCALGFGDVHPADYFYTPVRYLACHGVVSGYADGTYRPFNNTTRSQMVKIVVLGFGIPITTPAGGGYTFADVPPTFPFFVVVETAAAHSIVSGYTCGGPGEPCDPLGRPYFRPYADVTRGQLAKIDVGAAGWPLQDPPTGRFADVAPGSAFYPFVETAAAHAVISGYACGGPGEPCGPGARPYFRPAHPATRGQIAKIVYLSLPAGAGR